MAKAIASITVSVDGYITAPDDGPGQGLGVGGERLHYWVFGGPWHYGDEARPAPAKDDAAWFGALQARLGAAVGGRGTYEAARAWGGRNPMGAPFFIVTHRPSEEPAESGFTFVEGVPEAIERALAAAEGKDIQVMGGADVIRQALAAGLVDELIIVIAPLILGAGKRLFDGFSQSLELDQLGVRQSQFATFIEYGVRR
jgi:dihydrofolate reductase